MDFEKLMKLASRYPVHSRWGKRAHEWMDRVMHDHRYCHVDVDFDFALKDLEAPAFDCPKHGRIVGPRFN